MSNLKVQFEHGNQKIFIVVSTNWKWEDIRRSVETTFQVNLTNLRNANYQMNATSSKTILDELRIAELDVIQINSSSSTPNSSPTFFNSNSNHKLVSTNNSQKLQYHQIQEIYPSHVIPTPVEASLTVHVDLLYYNMNTYNPMSGINGLSEKRENISLPLNSTFRDLKNKLRAKGYTNVIVESLKNCPPEIENRPIRSVITVNNNRTLVKVRCDPPGFSNNNYYW